MLDTRPLLNPTDFPPIKRGKLTTLQANLGYLCNLSCTHCHVNAGPKRTELMSKEVIDMLLAFAKNNQISVLDLTGGAPEMNPHFGYIVEEARKLDIEVIDRCNLTILVEPGYEWLGSFLVENQVHVIASLPCYSEKNVREQRGKGVFENSILGLQQLNKLGYGKQKTLQLDLVYNPNGAFLPPPQDMLEQDYKRLLGAEFDIAFNSLYAITNMPIQRFGAQLLAKDTYHEYMALLKSNFSQANLASVMCKELLSIDYQGYLYDCDFNQMLDMPYVHDSSPSHIASDRKKWHLRDVYQDTSMEHKSIVIGEHCYGCTAGQGSSCGGALES